MAKKRKSKQKNHDNFKIFSVTEPHAPQLIVKFSFIKSTPTEFKLEKFRTMPFRLIDNLWERYGVARCFDLDVSTESPVLMCWYPTNVIKTDNRQTIRKVNDTLFGLLPNLSNVKKNIEECLMTYFGTVFMRSIATTFNRQREYQIYMNSVSTVQLPVPESEAPK